MDELTTRLAEALRRLCDACGDISVPWGHPLLEAAIGAGNALTEFQTQAAAEQREAERACSRMQSDADWEYTKREAELARRIAEEEAEQERRDNGQFGVGA